MSVNLRVSLTRIDGSRYSGALPASCCVERLAAADLAGGKWTTDGRYVFSFDARRRRVDRSAVTRGGARAASSSCADIVVVDGERVSFFVRARRTRGTKKCKANGGRAFRNTASGHADGQLVDDQRCARGAPGERAYRAELKRVP